jgi:hypothetical protein
VTRQVSGDEFDDRDELLDIIFQFRDALAEFDENPSADAAADLSGWTQCLYGFCDQLEDRYGTVTSQRIMQSAWWEAKQV